MLTAISVGTLAYTTGLDFANNIRNRVTALETIADELSSNVDSISSALTTLSSTVSSLSSSTSSVSTLSSTVSTLSTNSGYLCSTVIRKKVLGAGCTVLYTLYDFFSSYGFDFSDLNQAQIRIPIVT